MYKFLIFLLILAVSAENQHGGKYRQEEYRGCSKQEECHNNKCDDKPFTPRCLTNVVIEGIICQCACGTNRIYMEDGTFACITGTFSCQPAAAPFCCLPGYHMNITTRTCVVTPDPCANCTGGGGNCTGLCINGTSCSSVVIGVGVSTECPLGGLNITCGTSASFALCTPANGTDGDGCDVDDVPAGDVCGQAGGINVTCAPNPTVTICNGEPGVGCTLTPIFPGGFCGALVGGVSISCGGSPPTNVCSGAPGTPGLPGTNGINGENGTCTDPCVNCTVADLLSGEGGCANGGANITCGDEISIVCNGVNGTSGSGTQLFQFASGAGPLGTGILITDTLGSIVLPLGFGILGPPFPVPFGPPLGLTDSLFGGYSIVIPHNGTITGISVNSEAFFVIPLLAGEDIEVVFEIYKSTPTSILGASYDPDVPYTMNLGSDVVFIGPTTLLPTNAVGATNGFTTLSIPVLRGDRLVVTVRSQVATGTPALTGAVAVFSATLEYTPDL